MSDEKLTTIDVYVTESYSYWFKRESIQLTIDDYPELEGKTYEEVRHYIESNAEEMKPTNDSYNNLSDQLFDKDIEREKIYDDSASINIML